MVVLGKSKVGKLKVSKKKNYKITKGNGKFNGMKVKVVDDDYMGGILLKGKGLSGAIDKVTGKLMPDHRVVNSDMLEESDEE